MCVPSPGNASLQVAMGQHSNDPGRTRTCKRRLRRPMPYPLGHGASCLLSGVHCRPQKVRIDGPPPGPAFQLARATCPVLGHSWHSRRRHNHHDHGLRRHAPAPAAAPPTTAPTPSQTHMRLVSVGVAAVAGDVVGAVVMAALLLSMVLLVEVAVVVVVAVVGMVVAVAAAGPSREPLAC